MGFLKRMRYRLLSEEPEGGADIIEYVFGIVVAVGLGAALIAFQVVMQASIGNTANNVQNTFDNLTSGITGAGGAGGAS